MSSTISLEEAQAHLHELVDGLRPGDEIVIMRDQRPVAKLIGERRDQRRRQAGTAKGKLIILAEDDEHLKDFQEYMP